MANDDSATKLQSERLRCTVIYQREGYKVTLIVQLPFTRETLTHAATYDAKIIQEEVIWL